MKGEEEEKEEEEETATNSGHGWTGTDRKTDSDAQFEVGFVRV